MSEEFELYQDEEEYVYDMTTDLEQIIIKDLYKAMKRNNEKQDEIERLNNIIKEQGLEDKPNYHVKGLEGSLKEYQEEVKRLNNIINELAFIFDDYNEFNEILEKYNYELKGSDKE